MKTGVMMGVLAAAAGLASAGVETQSVAIDMDSTRGEFGTEVSFQRFDTRGGTRVLEGVSVRWEGTMSMEVTAQSLTPQFIESGTWSANALHLAWLSFSGGDDDGGDGEDGDRRGGLLYSLGGVGVNNLTGDLTPGEPGATPFDPGNPGDPIFASVSDSIDSTLETNPGDLAFFLGAGTLDGFFGPFTDITVELPFFGAFIDVFASELTQQGTLSIDYAYSVVPAPAGVGVLAFGGLIAARRRR